MASKIKKKKRLPHTLFHFSSPKESFAKHEGETVQDFLARGGEIKRVGPGVADYAVGFTTKWPGGRS